MTNLDYLYNKDAAQKFFGKDYFVDKKLHFQIIEHGTILPFKRIKMDGKTIADGLGGIVDGKGKYIRGTSVYYKLGDAYTPEEEVKYVTKTVIYLGMLCNVWGHAIVDNLRRLWFLKDESFQRYFKDCPLVYVMYGGGGHII